jgi:hypothetical protein
MGRAEDLDLNSGLFLSRTRMYRYTANNRRLERMCFLAIVLAYLRVPSLLWLSLRRCFRDMGPHAHPCRVRVSASPPRGVIGDSKCISCPRRTYNRSGGLNDSV